MQGNGWGRGGGGGEERGHMAVLGRAKTRGLRSVSLKSKDIVNALLACDLLLTFLLAVNPLTYMFVST